MSYSDFLVNKRRLHTAAGIAVADDLHPSLHPWQGKVVRWAADKGRAATFLDTGMGKTRIQLSWADAVVRSTNQPVLVIAPLSVARQTVREAVKIDLVVTYVRSPEAVTGPGIWVTNYEHVEKFNPTTFAGVVLDESSILKAVDGRTKKLLTAWAQPVPFRLSATATPSPNDVEELCNQAEWVGAMTGSMMRAAYFVHDDEGWRLKGHARRPMFTWMAGWAVAARTPSDVGGSNTGYILPPLSITSEIVEDGGRYDAGRDLGQLFVADLGGVTGRSKVRQRTLGARVARAAELVVGGDQWIVWCGLNAEAEQITSSVEGATNVHGSMAPDAKAEALEAFQDGSIRVLVTKPSIAGFGMNFQQSSRAVFCGMGDSFESYYQAIRRQWRYGQTEPVNVRIVVSDLETQVVDNVLRKELEHNKMQDELVAAMAATGQWS